MNNLRRYGDQVQYILDELKAGRMSMAQGAVQLQAVASLAEQDANSTDNEQYEVHLRKFVDKLYDVIEKMNPERRVIH